MVDRLIIMYVLQTFGANVIRYCRRAASGKFN